MKNRHKQFVIGGEAVVLGVDGVADFNALHSRKHDHEVGFYALNRKTKKTPVFAAPGAFIVARVHPSRPSRASIEVNLVLDMASMSFQCDHAGDTRASNRGEHKAIRRTC